MSNPSTTPKDPTNPSGPVKAGGYTVTIDRDMCIGAGTCLAIAEEVFVLDNEQKAIVIDTADSAPDDQILDAAKACPTAAIHLRNAAGETVFPK